MLKFGWGILPFSAHIMYPPRRLRPAQCRNVALLIALSAVIVEGGIAAGQELIVDSTPSHVANVFSPVRAMGGAVDRIEMKAADSALEQPMLKEILGAGWQVVSYRQNTELEAEAWHWNPNGTWSDPAGKGYFTGQATPSPEPIEHSFGYALTHRGTSMDSVEQGFHYSRLTDGSEDSYWKSNPYLTQRFTGEDDATLPQWVILDLGSMRTVSAMRIAWGEPYASRYRVQFWTGGSENPRKSATHAIWQTFQHGIAEGHGGTVTLSLTDVPVSAQYLRIWMTASSNTCDSHGAGDPRNCVGYAIRELYAGNLAEDGSFTDQVEHAPGPLQSKTVASSVDPWHEASDKNENGREQVGFDRFFQSGITRGLPAMVPIAMIYNTPEDAAAEIAYLEKRRYPVSYVEMGEEPDGQQMQPEDYAALYLQFSAALHRVDPNIKLGGPSFEGANEDIEVWPTADGRVSWLGRFIDYLKAHGRLGELAFMSFEHYPYDCRSHWNDLYREPELITHIMKVWRNDGVPNNVPLMMTEGNMSASSGGMFPDIMGALWLADFEGAFLTGGGAAAYYYHYIPEPMWRGCDAGGGSFSSIQVDSDFKIKGLLSQYFATQLITGEWVQPVDEPHRLFRVKSNVLNQDGSNLVTAYAVLRPDGQWSLLVINKDHDHAHSLSITFDDAGRQRHFRGTLSRVVFGAAQYQWHNREETSYALPDGPPVKSEITVDAQNVYEIPKASVVVLRGHVD
jgi:F5/8 type C domain